MALHTKEIPHDGAGQLPSLSSQLEAHPSWNFFWQKADGTSVTYDAEIHAGSSSRACAQSGVKTIDITYLDGLTTVQLQQGGKRKQQKYGPAPPLAPEPVEGF